MFFCVTNDEEFGKNGQSIPRLSIQDVWTDDDHVGYLAEDNPDIIYLESELFDNETLYHQIREMVVTAVNSAYGTDDRHELLGKLVADEVMIDVKIPWDEFQKHFGRR